METKKKQQKTTKKERMLISVNVLGSSGAMRLVVNEDDDAATVTMAALKMHARQGRLPVLASDLTTFSLYPTTDAGFHALSPWEKIGWRGERNFVLCKNESTTNTKKSTQHPKPSRWRVWLHKSLSLKFLI